MTKLLTDPENPIARGQPRLSGEAPDRVQERPGLGPVVTRQCKAWLPCPTGVSSDHREQHRPIPTEPYLGPTIARGLHY
jgi:hypothetical protein